MPGRNLIKAYSPNSFYHVYSRGVNRQEIFLNESDYLFFIGLFKRYLSRKPAQSNARVIYKNYNKRLDLTAYCLMSNHFHLLIRQEDSTALTEFMRSLLTSYSMYFNGVYRRSGPLFESTYRGVLIDNDQYYQHISRYIHMNPKKWLDYPYSSLTHYRSLKPPEWLKPKVIMDQFKDIGDYLEFLESYQGNRDELEELKWQLADRQPE